MIAQVMRCYHLTDERVLRMPVRRFWFLYGQVSRLYAAEDIRAGRAAILGGMPDKEYVDGFFNDARDAARGRVLSNVGDPVLEAVFDADAYNELKALAG